MLGSAIGDHLKNVNRPMDKDGFWKHSLDEYGLLWCIGLLLLLGIEKIAMGVMWLAKKLYSE